MLKLREYTPEDAGLVASGVTDEWTLRVWSAACYPAFPVSGSQINALYQSAREKEPSFRPLMAEEDGVPVAHMIVQYVDAAHTTVHFGFVIVDPACRGKGIGALLWGNGRPKGRTDRGAELYLPVACGSLWRLLGVSDYRSSGSVAGQYIRSAPAV